MGSAYGSFGDAVASNTRGLQFKSCHGKNYTMNIFIVDDYIEEKDAGNGPLLKN